MFLNLAVWTRSSHSLAESVIVLAIFKCSIGDLPYFCDEVCNVPSFPGARSLQIVQLLTTVSVLHVELRLDFLRVYYGSSISANRLLVYFVVKAQSIKSN